MQETFKHKLDIYYLSTIGYGVTLIAYIVIRGTVIEKKFEVVWLDPIVYLLVAVSFAALMALLYAAVSKRTVIVSDRELIFRTRFRERVLKPEEIEWIGFRRERRIRGERTYPSAKIKLRSRRRLLRFRTASFERSDLLASTIRDWAVANGVGYKVGRRRSRRDTED